MAEPISTGAAAVSTNFGAGMSGSQQMALGLGQIGSGMGTGILGYVGARKQRKLQKQLFRDAQAHDLSMWQKQIDYNHPANQVARLEEAGLNPALLYGGRTAGGALGQAQQPASSPAPPQIENTMAQMMLPDFVDIMHRIQQIQTERELSVKTFHDSERSYTEWTNNNVTNDILQGTLRQQDMDIHIAEWAIESGVVFQQLQVDVEEARARIESSRHQDELTKAKKDLNRALARQAEVQARVEEGISAVGGTGGLRILLEIIQSAGRLR